MRPFQTKIVLTFFIPVKTDPQVYNLFQPVRPFFHHDRHNVGITKAVPGNHGVFFVFFEIIVQKIGHNSDSTLRITGITLNQGIFGCNGHLFVRESHC